MTGSRRSGCMYRPVVQRRLVDNLYDRCRPGTSAGDVEIVHAALPTRHLDSPFSPSSSVQDVSTRSFMWYTVMREACRDCPRPQPSMDELSQSRILRWYPSYLDFHPPLTSLPDSPWCCAVQGYHALMSAHGVLYELASGLPTSLITISKVRT